MDMAISATRAHLGGIANGASEIEERHVGLSTPLPRYSGFPWWHALLVISGRERSAAERLQGYNVHVYLPTYTKRVAQRCRNNHLRLYPIFSGMLFVPIEMMQVGRRDILFELCGVIDYMRTLNAQPTRLSKAVIESIRDIEARENLPVKRRRNWHPKFKLGQEVRLTDGLLNDFWGKGSITAIAKDGRIRVEVGQLLGRSTPIWLSASEIEAM
jgi:transcription antitermination factor NusG